MIHHLLNRLFQFKRSGFKRDSLDLEVTQKKCLAAIFKELKKTQHYNQMQHHLDLLKQPIRTYSDFSELIEAQIRTKNNILCTQLDRVEYTSGSTMNRKKILYSKSFLNELNEASTVWMADLYKRFPKIQSGRHYWTLSWNPDQETDDAQLFPWIQRIFIQQILLLNSKVKETPTFESSWFATLVLLVACRDLSLISIWSPTLLIRISKDIQLYASPIFKTLQKSQWQLHHSALNGWIQVPHFNNDVSHEDLAQFNFKKIWPKLNLISAWDASSSHSYYQELQDIFPNVNFQGKGLWATEGVITIPFEGKKVLSFKSHFYEFRCVSSGKVFPSWQLEKDQILEPIITASNGLTRYLIEDRIQVSDYYNSVPCFEFLGRNATSDLVGEKLTDLDFQNIQTELLDKFYIKRVLFFAVSASRPFYFGLIEPTKNENSVNRNELGEFIENVLLKNYNYKIARQLQQLEPIKVEAVHDLKNCIDIVANSNSAQGQFKVQSLHRINSQVFSQISFYFLR